MAFVNTLSQVKLLLAASYSACVVYTKTIIHLTVSKYPPLFTSTSVNNCEILRSDRTGVSSLSFRTNGPLAKYFCRPALRDSVRTYTNSISAKIVFDIFHYIPLPSKKKTLLQRRMVYDYLSHHAHHCLLFHFSNFRKWTQNFPVSPAHSWNNQKLVKLFAYK